MSLDNPTYHLILGSNLGDRAQQLASAISFLNKTAGHILKTSDIYETQPWGYDEQPWFLNQVVELQTTLAPIPLLELLKSLERKLGRQPGERWHARHIDLDILLWGPNVFHQDQLIIPHPRLQDRNFVLVPLLQIAPDLIHPLLGKTVEELYLACRDTGEVYIFSQDEHGHAL